LGRLVLIEILLNQIDQAGVTLQCREANVMAEFLGVVRLVDRPWVFTAVLIRDRPESLPADYRLVFEMNSILSFALPAGPTRSPIRSAAARSNRATQNDRSANS